MINKRGQHEAMGFIIIVALVIIVGVIFLGISMNKPAKETSFKDARIANFLTATAKYTSDCFENQEPLTLDDLKEKCYEGGAECSLLGGTTKNSCTLLNDTYAGILNSSWPESQTPYYKLEIYYRTTCNESSINQALMGGSNKFIISHGNSSACYNKKTGQSSFIYSNSDGCIITEMVLCERKA